MGKYKLRLWSDFVIYLFSSILRIKYITVELRFNGLLQFILRASPIILYSTSITLGLVIIFLSVNITYFIISVIYSKRTQMAVSKYIPKLKIYTIYLNGMTVCNIIQVFFKIFLNTMTDKLLLSIFSIISYAYISIMLFILLKKVHVVRKLYIWIPIIIFIGNVLTILYMF